MSPPPPLQPAAVPTKLFWSGFGNGGLEFRVWGMGQDLRLRAYGFGGWGLGFDLRDLGFSRLVLRVGGFRVKGFRAGDWRGRCSGRKRGSFSEKFNDDR